MQTPTFKLQFRWLTLAGAAICRLALGQIDDCGSAAYVFRGSPLETGFGTNVGSAGDVDGDGVEDLAIAASIPAGPACVGSFGQVLLYSGRTRELLGRLISPEACDGFGLALSGGADIDGDGRADLIVGADRGAGDKGRVRVYAGAPGNPLRITLDGAAVGDRFGASVAALGDLNQDGFDDFAIGAPGYDSNGPQIGRPGRVHVHRGGVSGGPGAGTLLYTLDGDAPLGDFGAALARLDDFNGDLVTDLVVGAPGRPTQRGRVRVYSGMQPGGILFDSTGLTGIEILDRFGVSLAGLEDVDGDLRAELLIGASGWPSQATPRRGKTTLSPAAAPFCGCWRACQGKSSAGASRSWAM